jgi:hypothetical protein
VFCASQPLPFHYIEIAVALFKYAGDAFGERRQRVYDLVENIRWCVTRCLAHEAICHGLLVDRRSAVQLKYASSALTICVVFCACSVRFSKIERGLRRLDGASAAYIRLNNVSAMEVKCLCMHGF